MLLVLHPRLFVLLLSAVAGGILGFVNLFVKDLVMATCHCDGPPHTYDPSWCRAGKGDNGGPIAAYPAVVVPASSWGSSAPASYVAPVAPAPAVRVPVSVSGGADAQLVDTVENYRRLVAAVSSILEHGDGSPAILATLKSLLASASQFDRGSYGVE
jgi:hypothetical protein